MYDREKAPKYQYGEGCLSDQLLGQWLSMVVGLGRHLPADHVKTALSSIFRFNWRRNLIDHENCQRVYAINDDVGLLLCTWPRGGRPAIPFVYSDEVWTGIEYQVASHMIYEDLIEEGLSIVKGVRDRHDGERRNPWNEPECGDHYARAMSSWALILALSGYGYSAPDKSISFSPKASVEAFKCFFSTGGCWGTFSQGFTTGKRKAKIEVLGGELELQKLTLGWKDFSSAKEANPLVKLGGRRLDVSVRRTENGLTIIFEEPLKIGLRESLKIVLSRRGGS